MFSYLTAAVAITYENVPGPYSYQMYCSQFDPPNTLGECIKDADQPACNDMIAGGVICHGI